jgi:hypothetical protein
MFYVLILVLITLKVVELAEAGVTKSLTLSPLISVSKVAKLSLVFIIAYSVLKVPLPL